MIVVAPNLFISAIPLAPSSPNPDNTMPILLLTDMTYDGICNVEDMGVFAPLWLNTGVELNADFDRSGRVDFADFALFANDWLEDTIWYQSP
jgi:hypothetical protein